MVATATPAPGYDPARAAQRIGEIAADLPFSDYVLLPPAHEHLCKVLAAAILVEWPDQEGGLEFLHRTLRCEGLGRSDPHGAVSGRVVNRAWLYVRLVWEADAIRARRRAAGRKAAATRRAHQPGREVAA